MTCRSGEINEREKIEEEERPTASGTRGEKSNVGKPVTDIKDFEEVISLCVRRASNNNL